MTTPSKADVLRVAGEPVAWRFKSPLGFQKVQINNPIFAKNENPAGWSALYTESQLLAMYAAGAEDMREQNAGLCERFGKRGMHPQECADAIRALPITPTNTEGEQG